MLLKLFMHLVNPVHLILFTRHTYQVLCNFIFIKSVNYFERL